MPIYTEAGSEMHFPLMFAHNSKLTSYCTVQYWTDYFNTCCCVVFVVSEFAVYVGKAGKEIMVLLCNYHRDTACGFWFIFTQFLIFNQKYKGTRIPFGVLPTIISERSNICQCIL